MKNPQKQQYPENGELARVPMFGLDGRDPQQMSDDPKDEGKDDEEESGDWGTVDPLDDPLMPPSDMDPSGPGSAV